MSLAPKPLDDWLARLETYSPTEIVLGLERVEALLARLELALPATVFLVGGTNGKGSSVAMLESLLRRTGASIGSYTSPHILRYNERIRIDGVDAEDDVIVRAFEQVEAARGDVPLTYFEFGTLAALTVFAAARTDIALLEVGMGGRLDAVNAVEPTASLITNVALDHCEWLGDDVEAIAAEKAGIMRPHKPVIFAARQRPVSIDTQANSTNAKLVAAGRDYDWSLQDDAWSWTGSNHRLAGLVRPALAGDIQVENAAGVLALLEAAGFEELLQAEAVNGALAALHLPGRMQVVERDGNFLVDVAHNPAAATELAHALRDLPGSGKTIGIIGMLDDKDVEGVIAQIGNVADRWIATTPDSPRALPAAELARRVANATNRGCLAADSVTEALQLGRELASVDDRILVTGSFFLVGPVLAALDIYSPR